MFLFLPLSPAFSQAYLKGEDKTLIFISLNHLFSESSVQNPIYVGIDPKSY